MNDRHEQSPDDASVERQPDTEVREALQDALVAGDPELIRVVDTYEELNLSKIARPHLFHLPEVSGLLVPVMLACGEKLSVQNLQYLCWSDGTREVRDLDETLQLPNGSSLWLSPTPSIQVSSISNSWSSEGRERFIDGYTPNPAKLFEHLRETISRFVNFRSQEETDAATSVLALWVMLCYAYPAWPSVPYIALGGSKNSGKTRVFEVLSRVVWRPLVSANMTAACLFRTLDSHGGTLLLDEAEQLRSPEFGEFLRLLLSGYKRGSRAQRLAKTSNGNYVTHEFDVYGPKAIAAIAGFPDALESRCIRLMMFRAPKDSLVARRRIDEDLSLWTNLRDDLFAFALTHGVRFVELAKRADLCDDFGNRDFELWQPLIALATLIEDAGTEGLVKRVKEFAQILIELGTEDQTPEGDEILLRTLVDLVKTEKTIEIRGKMKRVVFHDKTPAELLQLVREHHEIVFKPWSPKGVSNALRRYLIRTKKVSGRRTYKHITIEQLRKVEKAYGLELGLGTDPTATIDPQPKTKDEGDVQVAHDDTPRHPTSASLRTGVGGVERGDPQAVDGDEDPNANDDEANPLPDMEEEK